MKILLFVMATLPMALSEALAQVLASPSPSVAPTAAISDAAPAPWLLELLLKWPKLTSVLVIVGALRLTLKPLFSFLHQALPAWGLVAWDQSVTAVEQSKPMKVVYFVLDYLGSIKMPVKQDPGAPANQKLS